MTPQNQARQPGVSSKRSENVLRPPAPPILHISFLKFVSLLRAHSRLTCAQLAPFGRWRDRRAAAHFVVIISARRSILAPRLALPILFSKVFSYSLTLGLRFLYLSSKRTPLYPRYAESALPLFRFISDAVIAPYKRTKDVRIRSRTPFIPYYVRSSPITSRSYSRLSLSPFCFAFGSYGTFAPAPGICVSEALCRREKTWLSWPEKVFPNFAKRFG